MMKRREEKRQKIPNHRKRIQTVQLTKGSYIWYKRHSLFKTNSFVLVSIFFCILLPELGATAFFINHYVKVEKLKIFFIYTDTPTYITYTAFISLTSMENHNNNINMREVSKYTQTYSNDYENIYQEKIKLKKN